MAGQDFQTSVFAEPGSVSQLLPSLPSAPRNTPFRRLWIDPPTIEILN